MAATPSTQSEAGTQDAEAGAGIGAFPDEPFASPTDSRRIGRILIDEGLIDEDQLARALRVQDRLEGNKPLATLLVELGWLSRTALDAALKRHRRELSVEGILLEKGAITADQLAGAREAVRGTENASPAEHLVAIGAITERTRLEAYCEKHDVPFVDADVSIVDSTLLTRVSLRYLVKHRVLPLSIQEGKLNVLVSNLEETTVLTELERLFNCPAVACVGEPAKIVATLDALIADDGAPTRRPGTAVEYHRLKENSETGSAAVDIVDHIISRALRDGASDIHVEPLQSKLRIRFRIDGGLVHVTDYPISFARSILSRIKVLAGADIAEHRIHQDGRIDIQSGGEEIDVRASFYVTVYGENATLRILRKAKALVGLEQMGFSPGTLKAFVEDALDTATGIILVTGPTGSGKTTTLYAAVERLNDDTCKIITCEDPVEYIIDGIAQCSVANRPGITFVDSLRAIVRQDPDIILVGEIRDAESAHMAIQAALTGHKVLSTFHTEDSTGALVRLTEMGLEPFLMASTVTAVLAQRLVRKQCPQCRIDHTPTAGEIRALSLPRDEIMAFPLTRGRGCPQCFYTGYRGRIGVFELVIMDDLLRDAIMRKVPAHELRKLAFDTPGFLCLQEDGIAKALRGETTLSEVAENCPRSKIVRPLARLLEMQG